jgi:hypothetical protein
MTRNRLMQSLGAAEGWERALVTLYFFTGIRRGEALALTSDKVYLDRDRALINRSLSIRYGITTPKTKSSRRMIQYGPRVRTELLKQRERVQLRSKFVFPNRSGARPMCDGRPTWCGAGFSRERKFRTGQSGSAATVSQCWHLSSTKPSTGFSGRWVIARANAVEALLALDTDRRSFYRRNVFAGELRDAVGLKSCPPYAHPARNGHRSGLVKQ